MRLGSATPWSAAAVAVAIGVAPLSPAEEVLYREYARVLERYVDDAGLVDYRGLAGAGRQELAATMARLAAAEPERLPDEDHRFAFWINAYNAAVLWEIVERYPLESVREVGLLWGLLGGFFQQRLRIAGQDLSLDDIEHRVLRRRFRDARLHWALVCGAMGCPRLLRRPYAAADLDELLTAQAREFLAQPRGLQLDAETGTLRLSRYFDWYAADFEAEAGSVLDYVLRYAPADTAAYIRAHRDALVIRFIDYDWALNDQAKGPRRPPMPF